MSAPFFDNYKSVFNIMCEIVEEQCQVLQLGNIELSEMLFNITHYLSEDVDALVKKDPAALNSKKYVEETYNSILAVMYYRIAHYIYELKDIYDFYIDDDDSCDEEIKTDDFIEMQKQQYVTLARQLSETAKTKTCIEIHPAATIGHNFVVDHGIGTVIGETCEIGDNCYILQGVVLGALGISSNLSGKRHPTLKDNVEIGAFSRVLGPVTIGENSIINSYCIIISDLPPNSKVSITNQLQITSSKTHSSERPSIYGVVPTDSVLNIYGKNMFMVRKIELIEYDYTLNNTNNSMFLGNCTYNIVSDDRIELKLVDNKQLKSASFKDLAIIIYYKINCNMNYTVITNSRGVYDYVKNQIS